MQERQLSSHRPSRRRSFQWQQTRLSHTGQVVTEHGTGTTRLTTICPRHWTPVTLLKRLSHQMPQKPTYGLGSLRRIRLVTLYVTDRIVLANRASVLWILDD
jgi:hypothetical protein